MVVVMAVLMKVISGLLSLGYEIGAILNRRTETWYGANGLQVTKESIKELQKEFIQIKVPCRAFIVVFLVVTDVAIAGAHRARTGWRSWQWRTS
jgi:hypothetical protein